MLRRVIRAMSSPLWPQYVGSAGKVVERITKPDAYAPVTGTAEESGQGYQPPAVPARQRLPEWSRYEGSAGEVVRGEDAGRRRRRSAQPSQSAGVQLYHHAAILLPLSAGLPPVGVQHGIVSLQA